MSPYGLNGRFVLNKIPVLNSISEIPRAVLWLNCDSGCTDPTQATARLVIVHVGRIQKSGTGDNNLVKWKGAFRSERSKWTMQLQIPIGPNRNGPFHWMYQPKLISGILGWMESAHWITGNAFRISLHLIGTIGDGFFNFSIIARSQILVNTLRYCFTDGLNKKFISVCGASCRVVRCQVIQLRIQWNFKFLERRKVSVI